MEFVGEAVKEYTLSSGISEQRLVVLGITTWGVIDNKENLTPSDEVSYDCEEILHILYGGEVI